MSELIEKLKRVDEAGPISLGFGSSNNSGKSAKMLIIGSVTIKEIKEMTSIKKFPVDAYLISSNGDEHKQLSKINKLKSLVWGLKLEGTLFNTGLKELVNAGMDFVAFTANDTPVDFLIDHEIGKILVLNNDIDENSSRGIEGLGIDAVILPKPSKMNHIMVNHLMDIHSNRSLVSTFALIETSIILTNNELVSLRDIGIEAILVDLKTVGYEGIRTMRDSIDRLPKRKTKAGTRDGLLTAAGFRVSRNEEEQEEEEED